METPNNTNNVYDHTQRTVTDAVGLDEERMEFLQAAVEDLVDCQKKAKKSETIQKVANMATKKELAAMLVSATTCKSCAARAERGEGVEVQAMTLGESGFENMDMSDVPDEVKRALSELARKLSGK